MITLIYRLVDREIVGASHKRRTSAQTAQAVITEIRNICQSELGGRPADYGTAEAEEISEPGYDHAIGDDGTVTVQRQEPTARERAYQSKSQKLLALGLTQDEIDA